ncbi:class I SAM-dependent methyltransferase [Synechococcus sp. UW69]|uniref:class I SAM-dependent methyltransferase n=1 Tax=Synechococcus sp. UW69 TaxID=368493 RepID=UPI000E0FAF24|nr:class I SAM-dependent methyltransferase [Synechococcus sp. UW69]
MAGFGSPKSGKNKKNLPRRTLQITGDTLIEKAINYHARGDQVNAEKYYRKAINRGISNSAIFSNLGVICKNSGRSDEAIYLYKKAIELSPNHPDAHSNLGNLYMEIASLDQALASTLKSLELKPNNPTALMNLGRIYQLLGQLDQALTSILKSLELNPDHPDAHMKLGGIYKDLGNLDQALTSTLKSLELNPDNPDAHMNLGGIYKDLGNLDQALASTLKSLELKPDNPTAHMNLGDIYKDLGNLEQALTFTLKSIDLKPENTSAISNTLEILEDLNLTQSNSDDIARAYELLLARTDISHHRLTKTFKQAFTPLIIEASSFNPIICNKNKALKTLASDWRFLKSLSLMIPTKPIIELFLTRLRREILKLNQKGYAMPEQLKALTEALAIQCHLNEYAYYTTEEEKEYIDHTISNAVDNQEIVNQSLAIIGCYVAIHATPIKADCISNYPAINSISKELIKVQHTEPNQEKQIILSLQEHQNTTNSTSLRVQEMYEENPYPRYKYSDITSKKLASPISKIIGIETTKQGLSFRDELRRPNEWSKVLIAGCGTGNQVINATRYKNVQITAIDISSRSLAYAIRKTTEYKMNNVIFKKLDLLNISELREMFDIIECSGVLHHMEQPADGLSALVKQLKPGGYIKLGLYSEIARKSIVSARKTIQMMGLKSSPECIRKFRKKVLDGEIKELIDIPQYARDFYSLSECRDLCFHIQEHRFTTGELEKLLNSQQLTFCGFMIPGQIKKLYGDQYPEDINMTSLKNWGQFEQDNSSTFRGMYQFWAQKK